MENNNPTTGPDTTSATHNKGGNKKGIWLIVGILVILIIVGAYWSLNKQQAAPATTAPASQKTPTTSSESLEKDLNSIDVSGSDNSDFKDVDADLQSL